MKVWFLFSVMNLVALFSKAQPEKELVLITIKDDKLELAKALKFLNKTDPKLICVNIDLMDCDGYAAYMAIPRDHFSNVDSEAVILASETEKKLSSELEEVRSLLMRSEIRPYAVASRIDYHEVTGCAFLYPDTATVGFINLIRNEDTTIQAEKFQIAFTDPMFEDEEIGYHFAVKMPFD